MHNPQKAAALVVGLLTSRTVTHVLHLRTRSYSQHMALGDFYGAIGDLADGIAETLQGRYDLLPLVVEPAPLDTADPIAYLQGLAAFVEANRDCCSDTDVQNQIDEVASLVASTLYKLRFLS